MFTIVCSSNLAFVVQVNAAGVILVLREPGQLPPVLPKGNPRALTEQCCHQLELRCLVIFAMHKRGSHPKTHTHPSTSLSHCLAFRH